MCTEPLKREFENNSELIYIAQSDDEERALAATEELIEANRGLVRSIALRFRDRGVEFEDLMQIGTIGMLKAIRSFDLSMGTAFSTYAVPLIFGEIRRYIRDEGPIKVGRYYKKLGAMLMNERNRILSEEGREAHIEELARLCSVSVEEAATAIDATSPVVSLYDNVYGEEGMTLENTIPDLEASSDMERLFDRIALGQAIKKMPELWQKIVLLRYYRDMTQTETATNLGLSQVKVSREEKKIFDFLRSEMLR
ncbi:MAG: sigma-70 family RNA polymerase sigma factor [Clostridia bacterium]|nr:sigma-70 family RNA polymerase sigma factor [Clostridia bacterium]